MNKRITSFLLAAMAVSLLGVQPSLAEGENAPAFYPVPGKQLVFHEITSGFIAPLLATHAGDGSGRLFIVQQDGIIRIWDGAQVLPTPFLNISGLVTFDGEQGLLGLAFHPDYENNGYFYVNYVNTNDPVETIIARYQVSGDPNVADADSGQTLLTIEQPYSNHKGGMLAFGPDGHLYIGMGDGGGGGDPDGNGQNGQTLLGKMLRIDVNGDFPYEVPASNPFVNNPNALDEIWAGGLRNPWRFSFDRLTGDLYIADVGQGLWEELNFQAAASAGGQNYGWNIMEGTHCYNAGSCNQSGLTLPVLDYSHAAGDHSITGGYVYRGSAYPELGGLYFFADYVSKRVWITSAADAWVKTEVGVAPGNVTSFGEDEAGEVYFVTGQGALYQIRLVVTPPGPFTLISPAHQSQVNTLSPILSWQPSANATKYVVRILEVVPGSSPVLIHKQTVPAASVCSGETCSWNSASVGLTLEDGKGYKWLITARNAGGILKSVKWKFTVNLP